MGLMGTNLGKLDSSNFRICSYLTKKMLHETIYWSLVEDLLDNLSLQTSVTEPNTYKIECTLKSG